MTAEQIILVKKTWKIFRGLSSNTVGDLFYSKLFADNPSLRKMFPADMNQQYQKIIDTLTVVVRSLENLDGLSEEISRMSAQHVLYGVKPEHYKMVGNALLWTLEKGIGTDWNEEIENAWSSCYGKLTAMMLNPELMKRNIEHNSF